MGGSLEDPEPGGNELDSGSSDAVGRQVEAVRAGDLVAFEALYRDHAPAVRAVVASRMRDSTLADDAVQEVFTRALEALPSLERTSQFRPWVLSIARHVAVDASRRKQRTQPLDEQAAEIPSSERGPGELAEVAELAALVRGVVGGLSRRDATAIGLVSLGFGVEDVAAALGISHGTAKVALHRARRRLRDAFVLRVMVHTGGAACPEFRALWEGGGATGLAAHVRTCPACSAAARSHALG